MSAKPTGDENAETLGNTGSQTIVKDRELPKVGAAPETKTQTSIRQQRWVMVGVSCGVFILLNLVVVLLVYHQLDIENDAIAKGLIKPADRTITGGVFMSLIGATVVETGYAIRTIMRSLFGSDKHDKHG